MVEGAASSLNRFLADAKKAVLSATDAHEGEPIYHIVVGNEASDADSMVSSLCHAYYLHRKLQREGRGAAVLYAPVLPVPREEVKLRTETVRLLQMVGVDASQLLCWEEVSLTGLRDRGPLDITLVDHNALRQDLIDELEGCVVAIVDHHEDRGRHLQVDGPDREIAFCSGEGLGRATVASTCTLCAERWLEAWKHGETMDEAVATMLLGVIMIDAAGLDPKLKKVTDRDVAAVRALGAALGHTHHDPHDPKSEAQQLFQTLSNAKFDPSVWAAMGVDDALRYDFKSFSAPKTRYGMSSVLTPLTDLVEREGVHASCETFSTSRNLDVLVLMSLVREPTYTRQFALYTTAEQRPLGERLRQALLQDPRAAALSLSQEVVKDASPDGPLLRVFSQGDTTASRKQVEPLIKELLSGLE